MKAAENFETVLRWLLTTGFINTTVMTFEHTEPQNTPPDNLWQVDLPLATLCTLFTEFLRGFKLYLGISEGF